ncbi:adenine deaminase [Niabella drilacis]|uniref:Adenine deaminase n=1 Tax=Niabella drilacis (strain DSM 25811 / CCM 8410 / CCUG 62505 / LMG 26954 / E90) TaxID=1285928 RepID=A0A1G6VRP8_NIADE|nr:adenine deaminase [Niabella drilacis]SDD56083.1 Adenine deaminase [Niabella drilacis]
MEPIKGNLVMIAQRRICFAMLELDEGRIKKIVILEDQEVAGEPYIIPGFVDSHVHIESSMLVPAEFARLAVVHGTVATVSDPHEIANVCGMEGVQYMIDNGKTVPFKFNFGAPSCVPATSFETAGARLGVEEVEALLQNPEIRYLSEMMNFPGVLAGDPEVMEKIKAAHRAGKPVDGHAPGLRGAAARQYADAIADAAAGLPGTDHECFTEEEALDKLNAGMKILIREGSAARNFEALIGLLKNYPDAIMFCSDDKHPDSLEAGHINELCARAVARGIDLFHVLQAACINPVLHYKLDVGLLKEGDPADLVLVEDLQHFRPVKTYINGMLVALNGETFIDTSPAPVINHFECPPVLSSDFRVQAAGSREVPVIEALDGQLITSRLLMAPLLEEGCYVSDPAQDLLKITVVNRYRKAAPAVSFVKNFGLKRGAMASSVAHDSHNIIAVGVDDESLCRAVNLVIAEKGGVVAVDRAQEAIVPLPVAGLMSNADGYEVAAAYTAVDQMVKGMGATLNAPFMTLSFMALLVIPALKLSDKGLFDGQKFEFVVPGK